MLVQQRVIIMSVLCGIDLGGGHGKRVASWLFNDDVICALSIKNKQKIIDKIAASVQTSKDNDIKFDFETWSPFVRKSKECKDSGSDDPMETPKDIIALAVFFAANVRGKPQEALLEIEGLVGCLKSEDFAGVLDVGLDYDKDFVNKFIAPQSQKAEPATIKKQLPILEVISMMKTSQIVPDDSMELASIMQKKIDANGTSIFTGKN